MPLIIYHAHPLLTAIMDDEKMHGRTIRIINAITGDLYSEFQYTYHPQISVHDAARDCVFRKNTIDYYRAKLVVSEDTVQMILQPCKIMKLEVIEMTTRIYICDGYVINPNLEPDEFTEDFLANVTEEQKERLHGIEDSYDTVYDMVNYHYEIPLNYVDLEDCIPQNLRLKDLKDTVNTFYVAFSTATTLFLSYEPDNIFKYYDRRKMVNMYYYEDAYTRIAGILPIRFKKSTMAIRFTTIHKNKDTNGLDHYDTMMSYRDFEKYDGGNLCDILLEFNTNMTTKPIYISMAVLLIDRNTS